MKEKIFDGAKWCKGYSKQGFVNFITNPKIIQAFLTGGSFALISIAVSIVSNSFVKAPVGVPYIDFTVRQLRFMLMFGVVSFWYWADNNQKRFEILVQEAANDDEDKQNTLSDYNG